MPVKHNPRGTPLRDSHPLKGGCIILGWNRPPSSAKPSTPTAEPSTSLEEDNSFDIAAHKSLEESLQRMFDPNMEHQWMEPNPSSESGSQEQSLESLPPADPEDK